MRFNLKDPGSAITHFIGVIFSIVGAFPLITKSADPMYRIPVTIFIFSMILLYTASTLYHSLNLSERGNRILRKIDHMMIFILIAGTYTPICMIGLHNKVGFGMLALVWTIGLGGIFIKAFWITCPKWFSSLLYISMGWVCILGMTQLWAKLRPEAFFWLLGGGVVYTIGGIIYALRLSIFNTKHKHFGSHEIFHLFVMGGSICHYIVIFFYL